MATHLEAPDKVCWCGKKRWYSFWFDCFIDAHEDQSSLTTACQRPEGRKESEREKIDQNIQEASARVSKMPRHKQDALRFAVSSGQIMPKCEKCGGTGYSELCVRHDAVRRGDPNKWTPPEKDGKRQCACVHCPNGCAKEQGLEDSVSQGASEVDKPREPSDPSPDLAWDGAKKVFDSRAIQKLGAGEFNLAARREIASIIRTAIEKSEAPLREALESIVNRLQVWRKNNAENSVHLLDIERALYEALNRRKP